MDFDHVAPLRNDIIRLAHTLQVSRPGGSSTLLTVRLELLFGTTGELDGQLGSHHDISPRDILLLVLRNAQFLKLPNMPGAFRAGCPFHQGISCTHPSVPQMPSCRLH
ncbi:hypothetical protein M404DRAFT_1003463 [Pisolithus tinctorius Marx 270]|uniref:Uncharacterized protein n=1 Tax=Pisolithus tinctorius Marx 270 TaxID=870435 RepID=A0A0C3JTY8_PISTI|nr:hypothetical protein M404DRAFT_1003463 [Pisolithus tinctorius Marx 270]